MELKDIKFIKDLEALEAEAYHTFVEVEFFGCTVASGVYDYFGLEACAVEDGEFSRGGWWTAFYAPYSDSVVELVHTSLEL